MKHQRRRSTLGDPTLASTVSVYGAPPSDKHLSSGGITVTLVVDEEVTPVIKAAAAALGLATEADGLTELARRAVINESRRILGQV